MTIMIVDDGDDDNNNKEMGFAKLSWFSLEMLLNLDVFVD